MQNPATAKEDRSPAVIGSPWRVTDVEALPNFRPDAGVFAVLAEPTRFENVGVEAGAVTWQGALETWPWALDLAPVAMHAQIRERGE